MLAAVAIAVVVVACGVVGGLMLYKRYESGDWKFPTGDDLIRVKRRVAGKGEPPPAPSKVIYLHRDKLTLRAGDDDAPNNVSSVLRHNGLETARLPGFDGGATRWKQIVACVTGRFNKYDVVVTDVRPTQPSYILVAVGGRPPDVAAQGHHTAGLAPFNSEAIPNAVVFAFSKELGNRMRETCETIVMEVGHAYGLDHAFHCPDVMTYLRGCDAKGFRDVDVPCGEHEARECANGQPTQNSYRHLVGLLGAAKPAPAAAAGADHQH